MTTPYPALPRLHDAPRTPAAQRALVTLALSIRHRVVCLDEQGRIIWANPAFSQACGLPHADVLDQDWLRLCQPVDDGEIPAADEPVQRLLQGRLAFQLPRLQLLGGRERLVRLEAYPTEPNADGAIGWVVLELPCEPAVQAASNAQAATPHTLDAAPPPRTSPPAPASRAATQGLNQPAAAEHAAGATLHTPAAAGSPSRGAPTPSRRGGAAEISGDLCKALERNELALRYQPVVALDSGQLTGAEALLRWTHPQWGPVAPAEFLPVADQAGHIHELGEWVLNEACRQWRRWQDEKPLRAPALLSVNLSRAQWQTGARLVRQVEQALARHHMPAHALQLEFSERDIVQEPPPLAAVLAPLRELGVHLAVDDYGTAASSLTRLRDLPFDTIKVDRCFVGRLYRDPQAMALAHATFSVIAARGLISVAEGVEKHSDVAALQAFGCRFGQGHLFGRPVAGDRLLALSHGGPSGHSRGLATAG